MDGDEEFRGRLRSIFDLFDTDSRGYISVEHFKELAKEHFSADSAQDIDDIVTVLDEGDDGKIYFGEFCKGVQSILQIKTPRNSITSTLESELGLNGYDSEEITLIPSKEEDATSSGTHDTSEMSTFNEYDMMTDDDQTNGVPNDLGLPPLPPDKSFSRQPTTISSEDERDSAIGGNDHSRSENDVNCEVEEEPVSLYEDQGEIESESESNLEKINYQRSNRRGISSHALASHLYRVANSSAGTSRRSSCSDDVFDDIDGSFMELNDKVKNLEAQIQSLNDNQHKTDDRHLRMKDENTFLVERVHQLEEQLLDMEVKAQERLNHEQHRYRESTTRSDRDRSRELEIISHSLQHIEKEYVVLKDEVPKLRQDVEKLRREKQSLEEQLEESQLNLANLAHEHTELQDRSHAMRKEIEQDRDVNAQLLDELTKELDELRQFKRMAESNSNAGMPGPGDNTFMRKTEMEAVIIRLKEDNATLREQNEDLQAQVLNKHIEEGMSLLASGNTSLAEELETLPRDELLRNLQEQQERNQKLTDYVDKLMLKIMENNPSILEVKRSGKGSS